MYPTIKETDLPLPKVYRGKVRDVYRMPEYLLVVATDRISAFDVVLNQLIPHKGTGLNQTSAYAFETTKNIIDNHFVSMPDPNAMLVVESKPLDVELVVRGYLGGSALREYKKGKRKFFTQTLPDNIKDFAILGRPIVTPTTKAKTGHDQPIETMEEFIAIVGDKTLAHDLIVKSIVYYNRGDLMARKNGGSLFDTKFEFGLDKSLYEKEGIMRVLPIDEVFTHDSSRFIKIKEYLEDFEAGREPRFIDKEPVRKYLESIGFRGDGPVPDLPERIIEGTTDRVIRASKLIMGNKFSLPKEPPTNERIMRNLEKAGIQIP